MIVAFMAAPIIRKRRRRISWSSLKSNASVLVDSKESNSSDSSSEGSPNDSDSEDGEGEEDKEEEEDDDDEEKMEYQASDYPKRTLGMTQMPICYGFLELFSIKPIVVFFFFSFFMFVLFSYLLA